MTQGIQKIVLAYSGGLGTSVIPSWLKDTYECPVIAFAAGLGQQEDSSELKMKIWGFKAREELQS